MITAKGMQMAAPSASRLMSSSESECVLLWLDLDGVAVGRVSQKDATLWKVPKKYSPPRAGSRIARKTGS